MRRRGETLTKVNPPPPPSKKTYRVGRIFVIDFEHVHGLDHALHGHEDVLVDQLDEAPLVFIRVTGTVDNSHLLDEGTLARFSSPFGKKNISIKVENND